MRQIGDRIELTAQELRNIVHDAIAPSISEHRNAREARRSVGDEISGPDDEPWDEEVDDFLWHNPLLDDETKTQLIDPGLLGHGANTARATPDWLNDFRDRVNRWVASHSWLSADLPWLTETASDQTSSLWVPSSGAVRGWIHHVPTTLATAAELLRSGRLLHELHWRQLEEIIGNLLESEGWRVEVTKPARDGGFDVVATRMDPTLGEFRTLWQAKKYGPKHAVKLHEVRELSAVRDDQRATKAFIVTTSRLTRDAIAWIQRDQYRLGYKDHQALRDWICETVPARPCLRDIEP